jgi:hypothetical protein
MQLLCGHLRLKSMRGDADNPRDGSGAVDRARPDPRSAGEFMVRTDTATSRADGLPLLAAAEVQDDLLVASNDLDRLQRLLCDASDSLIGHFYAAAEQLREALKLAAAHPELDLPQLHRTMEHVAGAITALQFQDMAAQLVTHTGSRLRGCADRIAREVMVDDEDGQAVVETVPLRPNPVTQDEMDAGSIELF